MELSGNVMGSIAGSLNLQGEGDSIDVNPIVTSGTKIATITVNEGKPDETNYDLYAPDSFSGEYNDLTGRPYLNGRVISGNMYSDNYSADEQVVGMWFGKPAYRKIYTGLNVMPAYNYWTDIVVPPANMDVYIGSDIILCESPNGNIDLNHTGLEIGFSKSGQIIQAEYNQNVNLRPINILSVLYTKTTD